MSNEYTREQAPEFHAKKNNLIIYGFSRYKSIIKQGLVALTVATFLTTAFVVKAADSDNNPPGPAGGAGTNWENPAGPAGGPGASPDHEWNGWFAKHPGYKAKADRNGDGKVDEKERKWSRHHWRRDNPPGPRGGPGAGPRYRHDKDNNPPGPRGGAGTNWENPPGPKGGAGASPDQHGNPPGPAGGPGAGPRHDRDNNPPGPRGGAGTNWENPPGPKGGAGASPDRHGNPPGPRGGPGAGPRGGARHHR